MDPPKLPERGGKKQGSTGGDSPASSSANRNLVEAANSSGLVNRNNAVAIGESAGRGNALNPPHSSVPPATLAFSHHNRGPSDRQIQAVANGAKKKFKNPKNGEGNNNGNAGPSFPPKNKNKNSYSDYSHSGPSAAPRNDQQRSVDNNQQYQQQKGTKKWENKKGNPIKQDNPFQQPYQSQHHGGSPGSKGPYSSSTSLSNSSSFKAKGSKEFMMSQFITTTIIPTPTTRPAPLQPSNVEKGTNNPVVVVAADDSASNLKPTTVTSLASDQNQDSPIKSVVEAYFASMTNGLKTDNLVSTVTTEVVPPQIPVPKPRPRTLLSRTSSTASIASTASAVTPVSNPVRNSSVSLNSKSAAVDPRNGITLVPAIPMPVIMPTSLPCSSTQVQTGGQSIAQLLEQYNLAKNAAIVKSVATQKRDPRQLPRSSSSANQPNSSSSNGRGQRTSRNRVPPDISEQQRNLPIYSVKNKFIAMLKEHQVIILIGAPGSGKSTQVPQYLLEAGFHKSGKIGVTEPRRVAAKSLAERVAYEQGVPLGSTVGYAVRLEHKISNHTVIKYMTDGVLMKECCNPAHLDEYSVIIIDEAHERSVHTDICFGILKQEAKRRPNLKIIISSATLEQDKFSNFFNKAPVCSIAGKGHEPEIIHNPNLMQPRDESSYISTAIDIIKFLNTNPGISKGDILVFLSGQEEIEEIWDKLLRRMGEINCPESEVLVVQCYGSLPFTEQLKIFEPTPPNQRKVILATNICETSITIDGVVFVIDCGFFKQNEYNPTNGVHYLKKKPITQFQAIQRLGRACRAPGGKCFRLYSEAIYNEMDEATEPEITRCNLESVIVDLAAMGLKWSVLPNGNMYLPNFDFMDNPSQAALLEALGHLNELSVVEVSDDGITLNELGKYIAAFPLDPPLAKVLAESLKLGCSPEVLKIISLLSANCQHLYPKGKMDRNVSDEIRRKFDHPDGDVLTFLQMFDAWLENGKQGKWCESVHLDHRVFVEAEEIRKQLQHIMNGQQSQGSLPPPPACLAENLHENIRKAFAAGYFRQFAMKKPSGGAYRHLANVTLDENVYLHPSSSFSRSETKPEWVIYHEVMVTSKAYMRVITLVDPKWIWEYAPEYAKQLAMVNVFSVPSEVSNSINGGDIDPLTHDPRRLALEC